jgi:hypothetical protein
VVGKGWREAEVQPLSFRPLWLERNVVTSCWYSWG